MNPKTNRNVTNSPWNSGGMFGHAGNNYEMQPFRLIEGHRFKDGVMRFMYGQLHGKMFPMVEGYHKEVEDLFRLYGYSKYYGRNTCKFVMSRAARKRGYTTTDWMYLSSVVRHKEKWPV